MNNCEALLLSLYICQCALILQWSHYLIRHGKAGGTLGMVKSSKAGAGS